MSGKSKTKSVEGKFGVSFNYWQIIKIGKIKTVIKVRDNIIIIYL
jgi:hypothetical protein